MEAGASWFSNGWALSPLCASFLPPSSEGVGAEWHAVGQEKSSTGRIPAPPSQLLSLRTAQPFLPPLVGKFIGNLSKSRDFHHHSSILKACHA